MKLLILLIIFAIIIAIALGEFRRARRQRKRRLATRLLCGAAGAAVLIAIAVGTSASVRDCYQQKETKEVTLSVPTKPLPARDGHRILGYLMILKGEPWDLCPIHAATFDHRVPEEGAGPFTLEHHVDGSTVAVECHVQSIPTRRGFGVTASVKLERRTPWTSSMHATNARSLSPRPALATHDRVVGGSTSPLSAFPRTQDHMHTFVFLALAAPDDPLRPISWEEFEDSYMNAGAVGKTGSGSSESQRRSTAAVAGFRLAEHLGIASLLLVLAAILLTQLFQHRSIAMAVMLAVVILFTAFLDHMALNTHLARLNDVEAPAAVRMTACRQAGNTFFYVDRSIAAIEAVAEHEGEPQELRQLARLTAENLRENRIPY